MPLLPRLSSLWRNLFRKTRAEQELKEEVDSYLEMLIEMKIGQGVNPVEARRQALIEMGGVEQVKEQVREVRMGRHLETLWEDVRYGVRMLLKNPGFTAVAVLSLAFGIGANTAVFSIVDDALLKSLPVKNPEQLVQFSAFSPRGEGYSFSYPMFERLRAGAQIFSGVFTATDRRARMEAPGAESGNQTEEVSLKLVSGDYFQVLGGNAVVGRTLTTTDDKTPGAHPVAVLSYRFWQRRFEGDVSIIGKGITLNGQPFTIIGVAGPEFFGDTVVAWHTPAIWAPLMMQPTLDRGRSQLHNNNVHWLPIMARLRPGVSEEQAQVALATLLGQIKSEAVLLNRTTREISKIGLYPGRQGFRSGARDSQPHYIMMAVVGLVWLIVCANLANLLLARAAGRQKEVAIRLTIGAGRFRLIRQFLTESLLLAAAGAVLGLLLNPVLLLRATQSSIDVMLNARILGFTIAVSLLTTLLFGLAPALIATRQDLNTALKATASPRPRLSLSRPLVIAQIALSLLLLTVAGLFVQTLRNLRTRDIGFAAENVIQAIIDPEASGYKQDQLPELYRRLLERLNSVPGIRSVSMASSGFQTGEPRVCCIHFEGYSYRLVEDWLLDEDRYLKSQNVTPGHFQTMGLPLLFGRDFTPRDISSERPKVAIISETVARKYFGTTNPVGKRFGWDESLQGEIIGVVKDAIYFDLRDKAQPLIYFPSQGGNVLVARATGPGAPLAATIRREIQAIDKNLELYGVSTIPQMLDGALGREAELARLSSFFSLLALLLSCIGLYGVMSYNVARRTHEIGVRMALGAQRRDVVGLVLRQTMRLVVIGVIIGISAALGATRLIASLLYGVTPNDPITIALAGLLLLTVAALAGYLPARRASRVEPMVALRHD
jgi:predicted permease